MHNDQQSFRISMSEIKQEEKKVVVLPCKALKKYDQWKTGVFFSAYK